jgi:MYXO-CTERM domain-containing protein
MKNSISHWAIVLGVAAFYGVGSAAASAVVITDDFSDGNYNLNPAWTVDSGTFDASSGALEFGSADGTAIHLGIPGVAANSTAGLGLDLQMSVVNQSNYLFQVKLIDTSNGNYTILQASPNPGYFGTTGMRLQHWNGAETSDEQTFAPAGLALVDDTDFHRLNFSFDPTAGTTLTYDNQSFSVANDPSYALTKVDEIQLIGNGGGAVGWSVDNVNFSSPVPEPAALGLLALGGLLMTRRRK